MAIASSCYLRNITKTDQKLLIKAGDIFNLNTTPSILMRLLSEFFTQRKTIEERDNKIESLKKELDKAQEDLENLKEQVSTYIDLATSKEKQLTTLKAII